MGKRFTILIEDDFELKGNGLGNVADLQYLPATHLMDIADRNGAKLTFMVEVGQQLVLREHLDKRDIRIQKELWDQTVLLMKERGFDVQLHIHPQWLGAEYRDGYFYLNEQWNIGCYAEDQQQELVSESLSYLNNLLRPVFPEHQTCAFKAGSWGMQPASRRLLTILRSHGIWIIMGVRDGLRIPAANIDYTDLEEKYLPYNPDLDDLTKKSTSRERLLMLPLQPYRPNLYSLATLITGRTKDRLMGHRARPPYTPLTPVPTAIANLSPIRSADSFRVSVRPYATHLKIGNQPYSYLRHSFDAVIRRLRTLDAEQIPVVMECHTKQLPGYYSDVDRFFGYINEQYGDETEFSDVSTFARSLTG